MMRPDRRGLADVFSLLLGEEVSDLGWLRRGEEASWWVAKAGSTGKPCERCRIGEVKSSGGGPVEGKRSES